MPEKKSELQKLSEKILIKRKPAQKRLNEKEVAAFADEYKRFLTANKTERTVIAATLETAKRAGFTDLAKAGEIENGGAYYLLDGEKNLALIRFGGLKSVKAVVSHADSPCLHLKPYPLGESQRLAVLKTHYYGGIKKYQWLNIPLAISGVAYNEKGERVEIRIGDQPEDPVITIPDLLPHLARDQLEKKTREAVEGEQLNAILGTRRVDDENVSDKAKLAVAKILYDRYGIREHDLTSAEISLVPAGEARYAGLDKTLIAGYGHDDRSSVYASLRAIIDDPAGEGTRIVAFYDKEEIGSYGKSGAQNRFFEALLEELIEKSGSDLRPTQVWKRSQIISADVTAAIDPNFSDAHDSSNATFLGYGVAIEKFGGGGGKYATNDAEASFTRGLIDLFDSEDIPWQTGELGKIDLGGGGTIAMFFAAKGADVIDIGVAVLGMHAPYEVAHIDDLYSAYRAYAAFLRKGSQYPRG